VVHGDLTGGNVVWDGDRPSLVDWEFWHWGDPAEDLAYLAEANGLSDGALRHVLDGHGTDAGGRVDGWRPVVLREIASWWVAEGRGDLALPHLRRLGVSPPTAPSGRTPPGASAPPA
jgi:aminoglycoside phosphotransferase (APT) family kinase protein